MRAPIFKTFEGMIVTQPTSSLQACLRSLAWEYLLDKRADDMTQLAQQLCTKILRSSRHALSQFRRLLLYMQETCTAPLMCRWNGYITYQTSGAGSWGEPADSCNPTTFYTNGGNGGFIIITATATTWRSDYYTLGSTYPQCTVPRPRPSSQSLGSCLGLGLGVASDPKTCHRQYRGSRKKAVPA